MKITRTNKSAEQKPLTFNDLEPGDVFSNVGHPHIVRIKCEGGHVNLNVPNSRPGFIPVNKPDGTFEVILYKDAELILGRETR